MWIVGIQAMLRGSKYGTFFLSLSLSIPARRCELADRVRSPGQILSSGTVPKTYIRDSDLTKAASTLTLGPFHSVPPTLGESGVEQSPFHVHFETKQPLIGLRSLKRSIEVSHWGANLNIQDEMALVNMGPQWVS